MKRLFIMVLIGTIIFTGCTKPTSEVKVTDKYEYNLIEEEVISSDEEFVTYINNVEQEVATITEQEEVTAEDGSTKTVEVKEGQIVNKLTYECNGEKMHIDKDILEKGNKIYDRSHMIFVPERINTLFIKCDASRGDLPIGCSLHQGKIRVSCSTLEGQKYLGLFPLNKPFQAFYTYKIFKEKYIKQIADEYKDKIPQKLYDAMYKYKVEIND